MLNKELVKQVFTYLAPTIAAILKRHGDRNLYTTVHLIQPDGTSVELNCDWIVQDSTEPDYLRYSKFADAKAKYTLRTGKCSREAQLDGAHLVREGDMIWPGSVSWNNLVVSSSGADDAMVDEGISNMIAAAIVMECQAQVTRLRKKDVCVFDGSQP